jgi:predicted transcriptional regulator
MQQSTDSVRIEKEILEKIRSIAKTKGQTISGYINRTLAKTVERQWSKIQDDAINKNKKDNI